MSSRSTTRLTGKAGNPSPELRPEAAGDVAVDVLHLVAHQHQDNDQDHGDQHQDQRVLDHGLTLLPGEDVVQTIEDQQVHDGSTYRTPAAAGLCEVCTCFQPCS